MLHMQTGIHYWFICGIDTANTINLMSLVGSKFLIALINQKEPGIYLGNQQEGKPSIHRDNSIVYH